ncbi:hypothetical protein SS50377_26786 [Spironucleus salmonicida]|uniref:Transmembrane protein n=1 Tax=Spironucleus salmonicida TaxID=348837 RepID=V6LXI1_9EUKA|nr:hypothetical protein SS50377_26786 [Spironucleus salmonicida]|eukprot:EST49255.1 Hypothetical protein SS50377_10476 [Spironucleus salmonicida]
MLLCFSFTPEALLNCYGLGTFATIQPNVNQVCVSLQPENSEICARFPHGVTVTLNMNIALTTILTNFAYSSTTEICFQCIPDGTIITEAQCELLKDTEFASMTLDGISVVSQVPIGAIMTRNSNFDDCFVQDATSFFSLSSDYADFSLNATGRCDELFNQGKIQKVDVLILFENWTRYQRVELIQPQYIRFWPSKFFLSGDNMFNLIINQTVQLAQVLFYIELNGVLLSTSTDLSTYKFFDFQQCYTNYTLQTTYDYFVITISPVKGFIEIEEAKVSGNYNQIILRTQFVSNFNASETYTYQITPEFDHFDFQNPGNVFSCKSEDNLSLCLEQRAKIIDSGVYNYHITFQLMLLKDNKLVYSGSFQIPSINASFCLESSKAVVDQGQIKITAKLSSYFNESAACAFSNHNIISLEYFNDNEYLLTPLLFRKMDSKDLDITFFPCSGYCLQHDDTCTPVDEEICHRFQLDHGQKIQISYLNLDTGNQIIMIIEEIENKDYGDFFQKMIIFTGGICSGMLCVVIGFIIFTKFQAQILRKIEEKIRLKEAQKKKLLDED